MKFIDVKNAQSQINLSIQTKKMDNDWQLPALNIFADVIATYREKFYNSDGKKIKIGWWKILTDKELRQFLIRTIERIVSVASGKGDIGPEVG